MSWFVAYTYDGLLTLLPHLSAEDNFSLDEVRHTGSKWDPEMHVVGCKASSFVSPLRHFSDVGQLN